MSSSSISSAEYYSPEPLGHGIRVASYAGSIAETFGYHEEQIREIELAGMLHDIGKLSIPSCILNKKCPLTYEEYLTIQNHPVQTYEILQCMKGFQHISVITLHHHERYDGFGYPVGLKGERIPFESQIISIADAFDAMTSDRPYRKALSVSHAISLIKEESGKQFHSGLVARSEFLLPEIHSQIWARLASCFGH